MTINKFTIYGERCSGTKYIEELVTKNTNLQLTWQYGWKHFFGFADLTNSDDTLFICIIRHPVKWIKSFYYNPHHVPKHNRYNKQFFTNEFYSEHFENHEIIEDRHLITRTRYKNIFELRTTKLLYLLDEMPKLVKNYILVRYDDLINNGKLLIDKIQMFCPNMVHAAYTRIINEAKTKRRFVKRDYFMTNELFKIIIFGINWDLENRVGFNKDSI